MKQTHIFLTIVMLTTFLLAIGQHRKPDPSAQDLLKAKPLTFNTIKLMPVLAKPPIFKDIATESRPPQKDAPTRGVINLSVGTYVNDKKDDEEIQDNTIAVSTNYTTCGSVGQTFVSAKNDRISYYKIDGTLLGSTYTKDFMSSFPVDYESITDPKLLFDSDYNRYIFSFFILTNAFDKTRLYVYVSETCDPLGNWYGLIIQDSLFLPNTQVFDRPVIGMCDKELYISVNTFDDGQNSTFRGSRLLAIEKDSFYYQKTVFLRDANIPGISEIYGLHPVSYGYIGNYYPGVYLVYTKQTDQTIGADSVFVYNVTNYIYDTPTYILTGYQTSLYHQPDKLPQKNSLDSLYSGVSRVYDAFYMDGILHFVYPKKGTIYPNLTEISYNRISVADSQLTETIYANPNYGCSDPTITSFTNNITDKTALIGFLTSGPTTYPSFRAVACDDDLTWGNELLIVAGDTIYKGSSTGQWGDYIGSFKNHSSTTEPICWISGQYPSINIALSDSFIIIGPDTIPITPHLDTLFNVNTYNAEIKKNPFGNGIYDASYAIPLVIYPNPTNDYFSILFPKERIFQEVKISLLDIQGKQIKDLYSGYIDKMPKQFFVGNVGKGLYIMQITDKNNKPLNYEKIYIY